MTPVATIELAIELPPMPAPLWPNFRSRSHWPRARAISAYRRDAKICALKALGAARPRASAGVVTLTLLFPNRRNWPDPSNVVSAFKAGLDGLVDAGVFADDKHVQFGEVELRVHEGRSAVLAHVVSRLEDVFVGVDLAPGPSRSGWGRP